MLRCINVFPLIAMCILMSGCGGSKNSVAPLSSDTRRVGNNPDWLFSPYNWHIQPSKFAETTQPGAYLKTTFMGTRAVLELDLSPLESVQEANWPEVLWQVDNGPLETRQLATQDAHLPLNTVALSGGSHTLSLWFVAADEHSNRWNTPAEVVRVLGITADTMRTGTPPPPLSRRMIFFGDSITQGIRTRSASELWINNDNSTDAYPYSCAKFLHAEFGVVGIGGQGWTVSVSSGNNVPPFPQAWAYMFKDHPRLFVPEPDYLIVMQGTNDPPTTDVSSGVQSWLANARLMMKSTAIFVVVPFGGFHRADITMGVNAYKAQHPTDRSVYLIDLGVSAQAGLTGFVTGGTETSYDGLHPNATTSAAMGVELAKAIQAAAAH